MVSENRAQIFFTQFDVHATLVHSSERLKAGGDPTAIVLPASPRIGSYLVEALTWDWKRQPHLGADGWVFRAVEVGVSHQGDADVRFSFNTQGSVRGLLDIIDYTAFISLASNGQRERYEELRSQNPNFPFGMSLEEQVQFAQRTAQSILYARRHFDHRQRNTVISPLAKPEEDGVLWVPQGVS